ncbi:hypothetical protein IKG49_02300 [Candidatus Saccharibacteria bacterium]|nr:hypothetical protein [Candidatus Saccharibacteria bacterium]
MGNANIDVEWQNEAVSIFGRDGEVDAEEFFGKKYDDDVIKLRSGNIEDLLRILVAHAQECECKKIKFRYPELLKLLLGDEEDWNSYMKFVRKRYIKIIRMR